jgi:hypothetical protein
VLHGAGQVAALLLEIERARHGPRLPAPAPMVTTNHVLPWPDGAAPLIGSMPAMRVLRHRIGARSGDRFRRVDRGRDQARNAP